MPESNLNDLVAEIIEDGVVDAAEVSTLRANLFADGEIDRAEVDALFQINDAVTGNDNDPAWTELFVEAVSSHIMDDAVIDDEEVNYLIEKIGADGQTDATETALLQNLQAQAGDNFPAQLAALIA